MSAMRVDLVLHEASRTGAPRVGGLIAAALGKRFEVRVLCLGDGPLIGWLRDRLGADRVSLLDFGDPRHRTPFTQRVQLAAAAMAETRPDLLYVNSIAASEFVFAGAASGIATVVNIHENAEMIRRLMEIDLTKREVLSICDGVILAAADQRRDLAEVFGFVPERTLDFGIAVDREEIARLAVDGEAVARNAAGDQLRWGERLCIGMCGHASRRKGADIFFEAAAAVPHCDFLWVGNWDRHDAPENPAGERFLSERLPNLYVTGGVDNPYQYFRRLDLLFLSSRDEANPVIIAEVMALGVPVLAFSRTTAVADFLGRSGILCYSEPNLEDAVRVLQGLDATVVRSDDFRSVAADMQSHYDIVDKTPGLVQFLTRCKIAALEGGRDWRR